MGQTISSFYNVNLSSLHQQELSNETDLLFQKASQTIEQHIQEINKIGSCEPRYISIKKSVALAITLSPGMQLRDFFHFVKNTNTFEQEIYCKLCTEFIINQNDENEIWSFDDFSHLLRYELFSQKIAKFLFGVEGIQTSIYKESLEVFYKIAFFVLTNQTNTKITGSVFKTFLNITLKNDKIAWAGLIFDRLSDETSTKVTKDAYKIYHNLAIDLLFPLLKQELVKINNQHSELFLNQCITVIQEKSDEIVSETFFLMNENRQQDHVLKDVFIQKFYDPKIQTYLKGFIEYLLEDVVREFKKRISDN